jgi:hypothetical protein
MSDVSELSRPMSAATSPTNIGGYMWSTVIARELGIINSGECRTRLAQTLTTMSRLKHHEPSGGMFYNWFDILPAVNGQDSNCYATLGGRAC